MRITDRFSSEHAVFVQQLDAIADLRTSRVEAPALVAAVRTLAAPLLRHAENEESALFPDLARTLGPEGGPLAVLTAEHVLIHGYLDHIWAEPTRAELVDALDGLAGLLREHIAKEEDVLFPLADRLIGDDRLRELGAQATRAVVHVGR